MNDQLTIRDVGPIGELAIRVQPGGGVTVLRGANGTGKTAALNAAETLVRGNGKLATRDGARGSGRVEGFGAMLMLGRKATRAGEVEVSTLEGKLNIADLVSPPLKDPAAADRQRIKALVSLTGQEPTPAMFREVIGESAEAISAATWAGSDLLDVAAKAKRDLEAAAREVENTATLRQGQAQACEESAQGVDMAAPDDEQALRQAHVEASGRLSVLRERQRAAADAKERIESSREKLAELKAEYAGPIASLAQEAYDQASVAVDNCEEAVLALREQLREAESRLTNAQHNQRSAKQSLVSAKQHEAMVAQYEATLNETATTAPSPDEMDDAIAAVNAASEAIEQGAIVRRARAELVKAEQCRLQAQAATNRAATLRDAAAQIDQVLSNAIQSDSLYVRDGRLYTTTETRGETLFHELSDGERWELAFDIAAPAVGERGLLVLPQDAWQHLDPASRAHVAQLARQKCINVLTAEAADGDLRAEQYEGSAA